MAETFDVSNGVNETFRKRSRLGWLPGDQQEDQPHEEPVSPCNGCDKADTCKNICQKLKSIVQSTNGCAEIQDKDAIVILPEKGIIYSFSSMPEGRGLEDREYGIEFNTDGLNLTLTTVFIEYFFKRRPLYDIADDLGVGFSTVHAYFTRAVERINRIVRILDARESVLKYTGKNSNINRYTDDEKAFLLSHVFGFKVEEIADVLGGPGPARWKKRITQKHREMDGVLSGPATSL